MDPSQALREAFKLLSQKETESAQALFTAVIEQDSEKHQAYHGRAMIYRLQGNLEEALQEVDTALTKRPNQPEYVRTRAGILGDLGRYEDAILSCSQMLTQQISADLFYQEIGYLLFRQGKWDQAVTPLQNALALNPDNAEAERLLAHAYMSLSRPTEAAGIWERLIARDPGRADYHYYLGLSLLNADMDHQKALKSLKAAVRLDATEFEDKVSFQIRQRGLDTP